MTKSNQQLIKQFNLPHLTKFIKCIQLFIRSIIEISIKLLFEILPEFGSKDVP